MAPVGADQPKARSAEPAGRVTVLDTGSSWRCYVVRGSELARTASGDLKPLNELAPSAEVKTGGQSVLRLQEAALLSHTRPPGDWTAPDFDDGAWVRSPGPFYAFARDAYGYRGVYQPVMLICLRGRFAVEDPAKAEHLLLSLKFQGGAVVYLNGREVARAFLPAEGKVGLDTPAEDYPPEAFVAPDGALLRHRYGDPQKYPDRFALRTREISDLEIPVTLLRKGVNVLGIEVHRAPAPEVMFTKRTKEVHPRPGAWWPRAAVEEIALQAPVVWHRLLATGGAAAAPNPPRPQGLCVWNQDPLWGVATTDRGDPNEPIRPIALCGVRNGWFSGQVVVGSTEAIAGLSATAGDLVGPMTIPASAVRVRYALPDGLRRSEAMAPYFDSLDDAAPAEVPVDAAGGAAVQPVWVTVGVPRDARPGDYRGTLTLRARDRAAVEVPVCLRVMDWTLPDPRDFGTHVGLMQSPESVALKYNVPLWSEAHWRLLERSFDLLGQVGTKVVYLTFIRRTHFGNEHGMVRWVRQADGSLKPDFAVAEKYLDLAVRRLGRVSVVGLYCWEPLHTGHYEHKTFHGDREILISVLDPRTGALEEAKGPAWGTPECRAFWKEAVEGLRPILRRHGLERAMMLGISGDYAPSKAVVDDLAAAAPNAPWVAHSHVFWDSIQGRPVGYLAVLWGMYGLSDPAVASYGQQRFYGWRDSPFLITRFPRDELRLPAAPLARYRVYPEEWTAARGKWLKGPSGNYWSGARGFGRVGADFWPVLADARGRPQRLLNRYPADSSWGQLTLEFSNPAVLGPGRDGPVATGRLEMLREGLQETEARLFLERTLLDAEKRAALGDDLAGRVQAMLDERVRDLLRAVGEKGTGDWLWFVASGWQERSADLYAAAAEVARRLAATAAR